MTFINLDRRFIEWREKHATPDASYAFHLEISLGGLGWDDLLKRRRVIILAEAGSGKTEEMKEQAARITSSGKAAFYARVQDVGREGLEGALRKKSDRERLQAWLVGEEDSWFFIDSVDEARLRGVDLEQAVVQLAEGIEGAERRAHIYLSSRLTDWEFKHDLAYFERELPIPSDVSLPAPLSQDEALLVTLKFQESGIKSPPPEKPIVVLMASLDPVRVREFAEGKAAPDLNSFLDTIAQGNLWRFARRPYDLGWLVQFWVRHKRLGSLSEMLEFSLFERLNEKIRSDELDAERATRALNRIGAALVFSRKTTVALPDSSLDLPKDDEPLNLEEILPDWSSADRRKLLTRPVFDPESYGRVMLHNDNEGIVRGYLTARWLKQLSKNNLTRTRLLDLLFANTYGVATIRPSLREAAAWLLSGMKTSRRKLRAVTRSFCFAPAILQVCPLLFAIPSCISSSRGWFRKIMGDLCLILTRSNASRAPISRAW